MPKAKERGGIRTESITTEDIEKAAAKGETTKQPLAIEEQYLYDMLTALYERYKANNISRDEAKAKKTQIYAQYDVLKEKQRSHLSVYKEWQENIKKSETARMCLEKAETESEALQYALEATACLTGDSGLAERTMRRVKNA